MTPIGTAAEIVVEIGLEDVGIDLDVARRAHAALGEAIERIDRAGVLGDELAPAVESACLLVGDFAKAIGCEVDVEP